MRALSASVVVPTRNRRDSVTRLLGALGRQTGVDGGFEVIVAADGCTDSTLRYLRSADWPFELHVLELPPSGPSVARNCGASLAKGDLLVFLDDDVEPEPELMRAHVAVHTTGRRMVGLGYLPPAVAGGLFGATLRSWWEGMFDGPRRPWHRFTFRDLLTGNFSISRVDFEALGGFDPELRCHEDWEFGYRAIQADLELKFIPRATACHYDATDVRRALTRKYDEGLADVQLARKHPGLIPALPLDRGSSGTLAEARVRRLAWQRSKSGDRVMAGAHRLLGVYERWNLRFRWRALLDHMLSYWYWRGVAATLGTEEEHKALLSRAPVAAGAELEVDLAAGIEGALRVADAKRPRSIRVLHGGKPIGTIPDMAGAERLRAVHVRRFLARELGQPVARALVQQGGRGVPAVFASPAA